MAKKAAPKKVVPKKAAPKKAPHRENAIERFAERLEERFFEGAELATETSSAETNVALAALGAIEGPRDSKQPVKQKASNAKRKSLRPKKR